MGNDEGKPCPACGAPLSDGVNRCPACGWYVSYLVDVSAACVAGALRGAAGDSDAVTGNVRQTWWHPPPIGKLNERNVGMVLAESLTRTRGVPVICLVNEEGPRHEDGDDLALRFAPDDEVIVQVTLALPDSRPSKELARGPQTYRATVSEVTEQLRAALEKKRDKVDPRQWLALDAMYLARAGQPQVVAAYLERYGDMTMPRFDVHQATQP